MQKKPNAMAANKGNEKLSGNWKWFLQKVISFVLIVSLCAAFLPSFTEVWGAANDTAAVPEEQSHMDAQSEEDTSSAERTADADGAKEPALTISSDSDGNAPDTQEADLEADAPDTDNEKRVEERAAINQEAEGEDDTSASEQTKQHTVGFAQVVFDEQSEGFAGFEEGNGMTSLEAVDGVSLPYNSTKHCMAAEGQTVQASVNLYHQTYGLSQYKLSYVTIEWEGADGSRQERNVKDEDIYIKSQILGVPCYYFSFEMPDGDVTITPHLNLLRLSATVRLDIYTILKCQDGTVLTYDVSVCTTDDDGNLQPLGEAKGISAAVENGKLQAEGEYPLDREVRVAYGDKFTVLVTTRGDENAANAELTTLNNYNDIYTAVPNETYSNDNTVAYDITPKREAFRRNYDSEKEEYSDDILFPITIYPRAKISYHVKYNDGGEGELIFCNYRNSLHNVSHVTYPDGFYNNTRIDGTKDLMFDYSNAVVCVKPAPGYYLKSVTYALDEGGTERKNCEQNSFDLPFRKYFGAENYVGNYDVYRLPELSAADGVWIFPEFEKISKFVEDNQVLEDGQNPAYTYDSQDSSVVINSAEGMRKLSELTNQGVESQGEYKLNQFCGITFKLGGDIKLEGNWIPISWNNVFYGNFDGCGHTISGMHIENSEPYGDNGEYPKYIGLIGCTSGIYIRNLTVEGDIELSSGVNVVGGIAANVEEIANCTGRVDIRSDCSVLKVGGLAGGLGSSVLSGCRNYGNITLDSHRTGFDPDTGVRYADRPNEGTLAQKGSCLTECVGGIVAVISFSGDVLTVENCGNYGAIAITEPWYYTSDSTVESELYRRAIAHVGGIVGACSSAEGGSSYNFGANDIRTFGGEIEISGCVNRGAITGHYMWGGGIVGVSTGETTRVENCVNAAPILENAEGRDNKTWVTDIRLGGIVGTTARSTTSKNYRLELANCYNACTVVCTRTSGSVYVGELHGNGESQLAYDSPGVTVTDNCHYGTIPETGLPGYLEAVDKHGAKVFSDAYPPVIHVWEQAVVQADTKLHTITFCAERGNGAKGAEYTVTLYTDADCRTPAYDPVSAKFGEEAVFAGKPSGVYYYAVTSEGCVTERGSIPLIIVDNAASVQMTGAVAIQFEVSPEEAQFTLNRNSKEVPCSDVQTADGHVRYIYKELYADCLYRYNAKAAGYSAAAKAILTGQADSVVRVTLAPAESTVVTGNVSPGTEYHITEAGVYALPKGTYGSKIYIDTAEEVTLAGGGTGSSDKCSNVYIVCRKDGGANLTLQDVYLSNTSGKANMIDFAGTGNTLNFAGTNVLEQDTGASGYAMIHVPQGSGLTVKGGAAYMYKSEQGAGIGGNGDGVNGSMAGEVNGAISFEDAVIFMKGTKQGAVIGSGSNSFSVNGGTGEAVTIKNSTLNLVANARGAAIGGGAGTTGGYGCDVEIESSTVNINVNYTGAAIGGAGSSTGNDKDGGAGVLVSNSSLRVYISTNAAEYWKTTEGTGGIVSNAAVNNRFSLGNSGRALFDVSGILEQAGTDTFQIYGRNRQGADGGSDEETLLYCGGPQYRYVSEVSAELDSTDTLANWVEVSDDYLIYLEQGYDEYVVVAGGSTYLLNQETENVKTYGQIRPSVQYSLDRAERYDEFHHDSQTTTVQEPTCTQNGKQRTVCRTCGTKDQETDGSIPALGHSYGTPSYSWKESETGYTCTAQKECLQCDDEEDRVIEETVEAKVTSMRKATVSREGQIIYTAKFEGDGFENQTKEVILPQLAEEDNEQPSDQETSSPPTDVKEQPSGQVTQSSSTDVKKPAKPGKVSSFKLSSAAAASQKLSWKAVKGATGYRIIRYSAAGKKKQTYTTKKTSLTVRGLKAATTYKYRISAYAKNTKGTTYGTASKTLTVSTAPAKTVVKKATVKLSGSSAKMTVAWKKGKGSGYQIQYSTNKKFKNKKNIQSCTVKSIKKLTKVIAVKKNKKYYVRVRAYRTLNNTKYYGAWSKVMTAQ